jgi:hypothetical protein
MLGIIGLCLLQFICISLSMSLPGEDGEGVKAWVVEWKLCELG